MNKKQKPEAQAFGLFLYNVFIGFPLAAQVEGTADEEGREARDGIAQPEAQITHVEGYTKQKCQTDPDDNGVQNGYGKVDDVVSGAVGKSVGGRPEGGSDEDDDGYRNEFHAYVQHFRIFSKEPEDLVGEQEHGSGEKYSYHSHDAEVRNEDPCNSVVLFCSDVLTHHGGSRGVKSICALSGHMVQLGTDARNGRYRDSESVDIGVDEHL